MSLTDKHFWDNKQQIVIRKTDCLLDWFLFVYFLFLIPFLYYLSIGIDFNFDIKTKFLISFLFIGIIFGFIAVDRKLARFIIFLGQLIIILILLLITLFVIESDKNKFEIFIILLNIISICIFFYPGYLVGSRFKYVIWQYKYLRKEDPKIRKKYFTGKIIYQPLFILPIFILFLGTPIMIKIILLNSWISRGSLFYSLFIIIFVLISIKYFRNRSIK